MQPVLSKYIKSFGIQEDGELNVWVLFFSETFELNNEFIKENPKALVSTNTAFSCVQQALEIYYISSFLKHKNIKIQLLAINSQKKQKSTGIIDFKDANVVSASRIKEILFTDSEYNNVKEKSKVTLLTDKEKLVFRGNVFELFVSGLSKRNDYMHKDSINKNILFCTIDYLISAYIHIYKKDFLDFLLDYLLFKYEDNVFYGKKINIENEVIDLVTIISFYSTTLSHINCSYYGFEPICLSDNDIICIKCINLHYKNYGINKNITEKELIEKRNENFYKVYEMIKDRLPKYCSYEVFKKETMMNQEKNIKKCIICDLKKKFENKIKS